MKKKREKEREATFLLFHPTKQEQQLALFLSNEPILFSTGLCLRNLQQNEMHIVMKRSDALPMIENSKLLTSKANLTRKDSLDIRMPNAKQENKHQFQGIVEKTDLSMLFPFLRLLLFPFPL